MLPLIQHDWALAAECNMPNNLYAGKSAQFCCLLHVCFAASLLALAVDWYAVKASCLKGYACISMHPSNL